MNKTEICNQIDNAIKSLTDLKNLITENRTIIAEPQSTTEIPVSESRDISDFESLKKALHSDNWPVAVNPNLICDTNSESDKKERGIGILELIIEDSIQGEKFLDFGCGEGHCVTAAPDILKCSLSVGYDKKQINWPTIEKTFFTSSFEEVIKMGPYAAILMFDVLDHCDGETSQELLNKAAEILAPNGKIYMRCHPWISRHGTHLYHKLNKAYAHLVFTEEELSQLSDYVPENNAKVAFPLSSYSKIIEDAGLKIQTQRNITEKVDSFFKIPMLVERIMKNTGHQTFPEFQMGLSFIDYILKKNQE